MSQKTVRDAAARGRGARHEVGFQPGSRTGCGIGTAGTTGIAPANPKDWIKTAGTSGMLGIGEAARDETGEPSRDPSIEPMMEFVGVAVRDVTGIACATGKSTTGSAAATASPWTVGAATAP